ncbi:GTP cyclohydrolase I FolE [Bdellovibrio bacteriovorus]|uniref:GTP cyclohydrolase I FolE n=1 Tax=Bdellovibrio bacteriovorus TaxID=959 RepID=UPI0021D0C86B|nr:GTP cyclohydrolase I FolE [Bdellovibrio bacteriovorus]UXR63108.1 GTP cyclohydrolase I FolE [Bdellovibrio bacteriovorus]
MAKTTKKTSKHTSKKAARNKEESLSVDVAPTVKQILENVRPTPMVHNGLTNEEKIERITEKFTDIMQTLGLDLDDDSLRETPRRVAKMYVNEVFGGLDPKKFPKMTVIENKMSYDQMIVVQNIGCLSFCEHHFLPIDGFATVAYIPNQKVIGLSKINRIVQYFSRRPQVQERLTKQIADCLQYILGTEHVAVHINAKHYCVMMRGIEDTSSTTSTSDLRGHFKSRMETREEFLEHCRTKY